VWPSSISCPSVTSCITSGSYDDVNSSFDGYIGVGTFSGGLWTWAMTTLPTAALTPAVGSVPNVHVNSISCPTTTSCVTDGYYRDLYGFTDGFIVIGSLNGTTWSWTPMMISTQGLSPAPNTTTFIQPYSVTCLSTAVCSAMGYYTDTSGNAQGFITLVSRLVSATTPAISNLPSSATAGTSFTAVIATNGDGALSLASNTTSVCTVAGLLITEVSAGTCSLTASVADGPSYGGAVGTAQSFTVVAPTNLAQSRLSLSTRKLDLGLHTRITLTTHGGTGSGVVTFHLVAGKCILKGAHLSVTSAHACTVRATKAHDATHRSATSKAVTFFFGFTAQRALILTVSSAHATHGAHVRLSTTGGTGTGAVVYSVTGAHCSLHGSSVTSTRAGLCIVHATKNWSATYLPATAKSLKVTFS